MPSIDLKHHDILLREIPRWFPRPAKVRILFLCEGLQFDSLNGFSFKVVIDLLRDDDARSYADFEIVLARWGGSETATLNKDPNPGDYEATYTNYRFHHNDPDSGERILDGFDQVWMFGISPNSNFAQSEANIGDSPVAPSPDELRILHKWMNDGGGVLAMGDHASLGASLVYRVPRVWTMRRWSDEQDAPPRIGEDRIDTNMPMWASQQAGAAGQEEIPFDAQGDDVAQTIEVRRYPTRGRIFPGWRPHPILCSRTEGVINHLPDHPHEGWVVPVTGDALNAAVMFEPADGVDPREYPLVGTTPLKPDVIAWGHSSADPPLDLEKGATTSRRFGVIGALDGHEADIGRVVVDSTWHHWMSVNLSGPYAERWGGTTEPDGSTLVGLKESNNKAWREIAEYFRNVAVWLSPQAKQQKMLSYVSWWAILTPMAIEDLRAESVLWRLGGDGMDVIGKKVSKCFIMDWMRPVIPELIPIFELPIPDPRDPFGPVCLSCPPIDDIKQIALGGLLKEFIGVRDELLGDEKSLAKLECSTVEKHLDRAIEVASKKTQKLVVERLQMQTETIMKRTKMAFDAKAAQKG